MAGVLVGLCAQDWEKNLPSDCDLRPIPVGELIAVTTTGSATIDRTQVRRLSQKLYAAIPCLPASVVTRVDEASLGMALKRHALTLGEALEVIPGRVEYVFDLDRDTPVRSTPEPMQQPSSGRSYLKRQAKVLRDSAPKLGRAALIALTERLSAEFNTPILLTSHFSRIDGDTLTVMIPAAQARVVLAEIDSALTATAPKDLRRFGPLPPYLFAASHLAAVADAGADQTFKSEVNHKIWGNADAA